MTREILTSIPVVCLCILLKWYKCLVWMEFDKWNAAWGSLCMGSRIWDWVNVANRYILSRFLESTQNILLEMEMLD